MLQSPMDVNVSKAAFVLVVLNLMIVAGRPSAAVEAKMAHVRAVVKQFPVVTLPSAMKMAQTVTDLMTVDDCYKSF